MQHEKINLSLLHCAPPSLLNKNTRQTLLFYLSTLNVANNPWRLKAFMRDIYSFLKRFLYTTLLCDEQRYDLIDSIYTNLK